jgi:hypothetical protein
MNAATYFLNIGWPVAIMEALTIPVLNYSAPTATAPVLFLKYAPFQNHKINTESVD